MIDTPQILKTEGQSIAFIHLTIPRSEIQSVMGPGLAELKAAVADQGNSAEGPWFTHHLSIQPDTFDFEISVRVSKPIRAEGRVQPGHLPEATIARTVYHGSYEGLGGAWGEFDAWIVAQGHTPASDLYERYLSGPESGTNPTDWRTELNRPLQNVASSSA